MRGPAALLATFFLAASPAPATGVPSPAECEARFPAAPEAEGSAECFLTAASGQRDEAVRRVEALLARHPRNAWLHFYLGSLFWSSEIERSADLFRAAAGLLAERGDAVGAVRANSNLYSRLSELGRDREAAEAVESAVRIAEGSGNSLAIARARILEATRLSSRNEDLPRAYRLLLQAEEALFPDGPYRMQRDCLFHLGNVALDLGQLPKARRHFERLVTLTEKDGYGRANALYNLLRALREELALMPRPGGREQALALARRALAAALAAGNREAEGLSHVVLGLLTRGPEAQSHFEGCLAAAEELDDQSYCRSTQARSLIAEDPEAALRAVDQALALARQAGDPWSIAYSWRERMRVSWQLGPPEQAVKDSLAALDAIEVMRDLQTGTTGRAEVFSTWAGHYHWLAGRMLRDGRAGLAFGVQERMRARALIDALEAARATSAPKPGNPALQGRREAVLAEISQVQRRLVDAAGSSRSRNQARLRRLEIEEQDLREQIERRAPAELRAPGFASLEQVRGALAEDEALLSFQIAPWADIMGDFAGGAWLIVVTRNGARIHPLRDRLANRTDLRPAVDLFAGLLKAGDEGPGAAALHRALLADGLDGLPPGIRRLVLVPDDALHRIPFAALRPEPGGEPLAVRYEISQVPSATLWLRWRRRSSDPGGAPALALADPESLATVDAAAAERAAAFEMPDGLGKLPWARREARAVVRHLGGASRLRVGREASEAWLKNHGASGFGIVHFATHAWTSDVEPERSFVLLSPGDGDKEDGFLQIREIVELDDLRGRIVVLSTCRSASGEILRGEGVMGLARAFFQAGAHTVVATLWPLRDDHGAALFDRFYHHLGRGLSVSAALQAAQRDRMEEDAPAAAWAGVVVLGDGGRVPLPGGREQPPFLALGLALLGLLAVLALWRHQSPRP